jgi:hypothetical protein
MYVNDNNIQVPAYDSLLVRSAKHNIQENCYKLLEENFNCQSSFSMDNGKIRLSASKVLNNKLGTSLVIGNV